MIAGIHITKEVTWRGQPERFENVYHYDTPALDLDADWDALIDAIVAIEKPLHAAGVSWVQARVHGPTDTTKAEDVMRRVKDLSGSGTMAGSGGVTPYEMAFVCSFYVGRSPRGYKVYLRKYFHSCRMPSTTQGSAATFGNGAMAAADKTPFTSGMNNLKTITVGFGSNDLVTPSGRHLPLGSSPIINDYLHVRQFRR